MAGPPEETTFEQDLEALEAMVEELQSGELTLEESLSRYQEGIRRLKNCYRVLEAAETKIRVLSRDGDGRLVEEPFEAAPKEDDGA